METKVLASILAFAMLLGAGIGWQLSRNFVVTVTREKERTVTWTITVYEGGAKTATVYERGATVTVIQTTTVTTTGPLGPVLLPVMPIGAYYCNGSILTVDTALVNAGDEPATIDFGIAYTELGGVSENYRAVLRSTFLGTQRLQNQTILLPGENIWLSIHFTVVNFTEFLNYVWRGPYDVLVLYLNLIVPYSWSHGSSAALIEAVSLEVFGGCKAELLR